MKDKNIVILYSRDNMRSVANSSKRFKLIVKNLTQLGVSFTVATGDSVMYENKSVKKIAIEDVNKTNINHADLVLIDEDLFPLLESSTFMNDIRKKSDLFKYNFSGLTQRFERYNNEENI